MHRRPNVIHRCWTALKRPSAKHSLLALLALGFFSGIIFWGAFNTGMEATNTLEFCIGCHEMRDTVYQEYKETTHYSNRSGVRVICSDCHVPKDWTHKMWRKTKASMEIWGWLTGTINTKQKFEAKRMELATREWERMKARDSIECRNCHSYDAMSSELQKFTPYKKHMEGMAAGKSCIDCHKGVAHKLPKEYEEPM
ncbi:MAG: NapC/NirT family cytochrome c [Sulfuritalea sp.]|jgi:cytochrome c-type protein NapC|nr:NapC/NirT family cytochrome c [Sulfuritalea sp.]